MSNRLPGVTNLSASGSPTDTVHPLPSPTLGPSRARPPAPLAPPAHAPHPRARRVPSLEPVRSPRQPHQRLLPWSLSQPTCCPANTSPRKPQSPGSAPGFQGSPLAPGPWPAGGVARAGSPSGGAPSPSIGSLGHCLRGLPALGWLPSPSPSWTSRPCCCKAARTECVDVGSCPS